MMVQFSQVPFYGQRVLGRAVPSGLPTVPHAFKILPLSLLILFYIVVFAYSRAFIYQ